MDLNVKCETIKLIEENVGENLCDFKFDGKLLDTIPKAQHMKTLINQMSIKIKNICSVIDTVKRAKREDKTWV